MLVQRWRRIVSQDVQLSRSSRRLQDLSEFGNCEKMDSFHACTADPNTLANAGGGCVDVIMGRVKSARRSREAGETSTTRRRHRVGARSTTNKRCPRRLHSTNLPIPPTGKRTESHLPSARGIHGVPKDGTDGENAHGATVHASKEMLRGARIHLTEKDSGFSFALLAHQIIVTNHWTRHLGWIGRMIGRHQKQQAACR